MTAEARQNLLGRTRPGSAFCEQLQKSDDEVQHGCDDREDDGEQVRHVGYISGQRGAVAADGYLGSRSGLLWSMRLRPGVVAKSGLS